MCFPRCSPAAASCSTRRRLQHSAVADKTVHLVHLVSFPPNPSVLLLQGQDMPMGCLLNLSITLQACFFLTAFVHCFLCQEHSPQECSLGRIRAHQQPGHPTPLLPPPHPPAHFPLTSLICSVPTLWHTVRLNG